MSRNGSPGTRSSRRESPGEQNEMPLPVIVSKTMRWKRLCTVLLLLLVLSCIHSGRGAGSDIWGQGEAAIVEITRGEVAVGTFCVALAESPQRWRNGLMHCPALAPATGMLFVYPQAGRRVFWMKNTSIELAIIFISADDRIAAIAHGQPGSLRRIRSPENIRYVLEINFLESRNLTVGDRVSWRLNSGSHVHAAPCRP
jgi:uncharacterized protein